ncbi:MAG: hypothetical protein JXB13_22280 [Phycisphaerae bacterium]|nr:hypothetical protein [Phycisphaerae bacterium]
MTALRQQVRRTQKRLWANRWFLLLAWSMTAAAGVYACVVFGVRLYGATAPLGWIALGLTGAAVILATVLSLIGRPDEVVAATELDRAAGLRERVSSGLYCEESPDPYAHAVVADAERVSSSLSVRRHIPLRAPRPLWYTGTTALVAVILLLLPSGWITRSQAQADQRPDELVQRQKVDVQKKIDLVKKEARVHEGLKDNPAMKDLVAGLENLAKEPIENPEARRMEAMKKIAAAADALRQQRQGEQFEKVGEMKKMLRSIKPEDDRNSPTQKLSEALAQGDFKAANEAVKALQEQLATMQNSQNAEAQQQMQEQLDRLAEQLKKAAGDNAQLQQKLEQAGMKKEDAQKLMDQIAQGDTSELEKQLSKLGIPQNQMDSLMQQMQKRAGACNACRNMSSALSQASSSMQQGQSGDAASGMQSMGDQLSDMEMLEQQMNELESAMASLDNAKSQMGDCPQCNGTGMCNGQACPMCQGKGSGGQGAGMGQLGQGRGGLAPEAPTAVGFKPERAPVHTGPGKIIGQFLVEGEQIKGEASSALVEVVTAEERNATDAIQRDRIPRQYQRSVKEYFSRVQRALGGQSAAEEEDASEDEKPADAKDESEDAGS